MNKTFCGIGGSLEVELWHTKDNGRLYLRDDGKRSAYYVVATFYHTRLSLKMLRNAMIPRCAKLDITQSGDGIFLTGYDGRYPAHGVSVRFEPDTVNEILKFMHLCDKEIANVIAR